MPALRSDDTLGFLAALGVLELCSNAMAEPVELGWDGVGGTALLAGPFSTVEAVAQCLSETAADMIRASRVLPCPDPGVVRSVDRAARAEAEEKGKLDPAHVRAEGAVQAFERVRLAELAGDHSSARWLAAMVNQITNAPSTGGFRALTPFYSASGQMTLHQLYSDHLGAVHKDPHLLEQALVKWERTEGQTGANLDVRALQDATVGGAGKPSNAAAVGATWLALMAVPFFPQASGRRPRVRGWESPNRGKAVLRWPIWSRPLDRHAVETLLGHPTLDLPPSESHAALRALGVDAVCRASRRELSNSSGALQPPSVSPIR